MIVERQRSYAVRVYRGRDANGREIREWVGSYAFAKHGGKRGALAAAKKAEQNAVQGLTTSKITVGEYVDRYLAEYQRTRKDSSYDTAVIRLGRLKDELGHREIATIDRLEAKDRAAAWPDYVVPAVITLFNQAMEDVGLPANPFRGLSHRTLGRSEEAPPTAAEVKQLLKGCDVLKAYAPRMRALFTFAAYTGMRPGEIYGLEWSDIDFKAMRITVRRRMWRRKAGLPKNNKVKTIALTPPARDALLGLPRDRAYVFAGKRGQQLTQPTMSNYWSLVLASAGLDFDFYLATKHWCVHYLWTELELSERAIAAQMGWSLKTVQKMLAIYGHGEVGALEEIDRAFAATVTPIRKVESA